MIHRLVWCWLSNVVLILSPWESFITTTQWCYLELNALVLGIHL